MAYRFRIPVAIALVALVTLGFVTTPVASAAPRIPGAVAAVTERPAGWRDLPNGRAVNYWTEGVQGKPVKASGALFVPSGKAPEGGWPVVAYTHGTTGYGPGCGGQSFADAEPNRFVSRLVKDGYAVVAPDYIGLGPMKVGVHPYLNIRTEATATIDLFTAARSIEPTLSKTWAVMGESQGGHAALATAHTQSSYGPRTDFRGAVALDPVSNWERFIPLLGPDTPVLPSPMTILYGFVFGSLAGLRQADPALDVDSYLTPYGKSLIDQVGTTCRAPVLTENIRLGKMFSKSLNNPTMIRAMARYMEVPVNGYDRPILLLMNRFDTIVATPFHGLLVSNFSANKVDFKTVVAEGTHTDMSPTQWAAFDTFFNRLKH
ncbi:MULTISPECIES: lipase family protein [Gordonia]|uniref:lipase family protein n=1 Tax=Gordonia TaxID=2053 RepID=UPI00301AD3D9